MTFESIPRPLRSPLYRVLVEYNPEFCKLLKRKFPRAAIVQGDAYDIRDSVGEALGEPAAAIVSSLPLFNKPLEQRLELLSEAQAVMRPGAPFIQFTYAVVPPIPRHGSLSVEASDRIWLNLPPARVWVYRNG